MVRRVFAVAIAVSALAALSARAQPPAEFSNPSPIDYTKPFLYDGVQVKHPAPKSATLPVEPAKPDADDIIREHLRGAPPAPKSLRVLPIEKPPIPGLEPVAAPTPAAGK